MEEAQPDHPEAARALELIGKLYEIDDRAAGDLAKLAELRRTESTAVLAELKTWLFEQATLKTLSIGKAAGYIIGNWDRLTRFLDDPRIPLDNNGTERGIRGPVVGRKITTDRSRAAGHRSRRSTTRSSRPRSCTASTRVHTCAPRFWLQTVASRCCRGTCTGARRRRARPRVSRTRSSPTLPRRTRDSRRACQIPGDLSGRATAKHHRHVDDEERVDLTE